MLTTIILFVALLHTAASQTIVAAQVGKNVTFTIPNWPEFTCYKDQKTPLVGDRYIEGRNWFRIKSVVISDYGFYTCSQMGEISPVSFQLVVVENVVTMVTGEMKSGANVMVDCTSNLKVPKNLMINPQFILRKEKEEIKNLDLQGNFEADDVQTETREYTMQYNITLEKEMHMKSLSCVLKLMQQEFNSNYTIQLNTPLSDIAVNSTDFYELGDMLLCQASGSPSPIVHWRSVELPQGCMYDQLLYGLSKAILPLKCLGLQYWRCVATYHADGLSLEEYQNRYMSYVLPAFNTNNNSYNSPNNNYNMGSTGNYQGYNSYNNHFKPSNFQPNFQANTAKYPNRYIPPDKYNPHKHDNDDDFEGFNEKNLNTYSDGHDFFQENNLVSPYSSLQASNKMQQKIQTFNFTVVTDEVYEELKGDLTQEQKTILGVVLGLGIPLIIIAVIIIVCCFCRGANKEKKTTLSNAMDSKKAQPGPIRTVSGSRAAPNMSVNPTTNPIPAQSPPNVVRGSPGVPDIGARHLGGSGSIPNLNESLQNNNLPPTQYTNYSEMNNKKKTPTPFGMADLGGNKAFTNI